MGPLEIILILVVLVLLFGASKLPELGKGFGKGIREFKKGVKDDPETTVIHDKALKAEERS